MSSSEALRIDAHDESCAHFKRRVGSLDGLDDRGACLTYAYELVHQVVFIDPMCS